MYLQEDKSVYAIAKYFGISVTTVLARFQEHGIKVKERKITIPKKILEEKYVNRGKSSTKIAKEFDVTASLVCRLLHEYEIPIKERRKNIPVSILEQKYTTQKKTAQQIADELECSTSLVLDNLRRAKIPIRPTNNIQRVIITKAELVDLYQKQGLTTTDIGKKFGCHPGTVSRRLTKFEIPRRKSGTMSRTQMSKDTLYRMHHVEKKSARQIATELKCSEGTVWKNLKKYKITVRGRNLKGIITKERIRRLYVKENRTAKEISKIFKCHPATIHTYLRKFNIPKHRDYSRPEYKESKRLQNTGKQKFTEMKKLLGNVCWVCHRNSLLTIHHMYYTPNDVVSKNYRRKSHIYHIDLEPLVRENPNQFCLLCRSCHMLSGKFQKFSTESRDRMFDAIKNQTLMREKYPTKHSDLVKEIKK